MGTQSVGAKRPPRRPLVQELGLIAVVIVLGTILSLYGWHDRQPDAPNTFLNFDNIIAGIATPMSYYAIMAIGVTCVIIAGGIDISVGSIMTIAAMVMAWVIQRFDKNASAWQVLPIAIIVPLAVGLSCGMINGALVVTGRMHPFIVTLATMSIFRGIANVLPFGSKTLPSGHTLPLAFTNYFMRYQTTIAGQDIRLVPMIITLICTAVGWFYLRMTVYGRENYAVGGNELATKYSGISVGRVKLRVYAIAGLAAGIAAMVSLGRFGTFSTNSAAGYELTVVAAAVVGGASLSGGRGSALGALLGTLILAMIENGIVILHLNQEYRDIIVGLAILIAVAIDQLSVYLRK